MKILFVCLGNICRSPLAKGILRDKALKRGLDFEIDSAGFEKYHMGEGADPRSLQIAAKHGIDISDHVARLFSVSDFDRYDLIYVMDSMNYSDVAEMTRNESDLSKVDYIRNLTSTGRNLPVPDPYYEGKDGFDKVYRMLDDACEVLVDKISAKEK